MEFIGSLALMSDVPRMVGGATSPIAKSSHGVISNSIMEELREKKPS